MEVLTRSRQGRWLPTRLDGGEAIRPGVCRPTAQKPWRFFWEELPGTPTHLRLTTAEYRNEEFRFEVRDVTGRLVGEFDIRYCVTGQIFEARLADEVELASGVTLAPAAGSASLGFYRQAPVGAETTLGTPHVLVSGSGELTPREAAKENIANWPVSELGFMEGCLLEALLCTSEFGEPGIQAARSRLEAYLPHLADNSVEGSLPAAALARLFPGHPELAAVRRRWEESRGADGAVEEGGRIVAEGSYTVAYPMAVLAQAKRDLSLAEEAAWQLRLRRARLRTRGKIWLRHFVGDKRSFPNWARGVAWYLLGLAYTLPLLSKLEVEIDDLRAEAVEALELVLPWQQEEGLWRAYLDRESCLADTSGSAGIAAALARLGRWMDQPELGQAARRALAALEGHITPDGLIGGATQHNAGGEALQAGSYRVYQPYTLAFYFLLRAEFEG